MSVKTKPHLKHKAVYQAVYDDIRRGELVPGQRLSGEMALADRFKMSRGTVRRGLAMLEQDGLLIKRRGSGAYIAEPSDKKMTDKNRKTVVIRSQGGDLIERQWNAAWRSNLRDGLLHSALQYGVDIFDELPRDNWNTQSVPSWLDDRLLGVIVFSSNGGTEQLLHGVPKEVPRVVLNRPSHDPDIASVCVDHEAGAFDATSALMRMGHRRIMMISDFTDSFPSTGRVAGYRKAFAQANLPVDPAMLTKHHDAERIDWPEELRSVLTRPDRPTALLMNNHNRGLHILDVMQGVGITMPQDMSLVLFDDDTMLAQTQPTLTCVRQPTQQMGRLAMVLITQMAQGQTIEKKQHMLKPELILRESVGCPKK